MLREPHPKALKHKRHRTQLIAVDFFTLPYYLARRREAEEGSGAEGDVGWEENVQRGQPVLSQLGASHISLPSPHPLSLQAISFFFFLVGVVFFSFLFVKFFFSFEPPRPL